MKKFLLSIFCCLMAVFAVQAEEVCYTLEPATGSNNAYASNCDIKIEGITWNLTGNSQQVPWRIGGKNLTNVDRALYSKTPIASAVNKVVLTTGTCNLSAVNSAKLLVAATADFSDAIEYPFTFAASTDIEISVSAAANSYYKFVFNVTAGSSNKYLQFTRAKFYAGSEGGDTEVIPTLSNPTFTPADGTSFEGSMEVAIASEEGATIYYTTNGDEPSTTSDVYSEPFTITETTTVKAYAVEEGSNDSSVASATYTKKTFVAGNWNLVSAVSELSAGDEVVIVAAEYDFALSATQNTNNRAQAEVQKDGNAVVFADDVQVITLEDGNIDGTFAFNTDNGYLYAASSSSNLLKTEAALSNNSSWKIEIADGVATIVAQGENARNTMQYNQSSNLFACYSSASQKAVSIYKNFEEGEQPVVVPSAPVFSTSESATNFEESIEVTITAEDGMAIYYTTDGNDPTNASDVYSVPLTITETTTVKAIAVNGEGVSSTVASSKYTKVAASVEGTVADAIAAYVKGCEIPATITGYIVGAVDGSINKDGNFTGETSVVANILIADNADETDYTKCIPVQLSSGDFRTALNLAANTGNYKKKITVSGNLTAYFSVAGIKDVNVAGIYYTVSNVGWATLYLGYNAVVPETVKAYIATKTVSNSVILEQVTSTIDSETGVILEGAGEHLFNVASEAVDNGKGLLKGSVANSYVEGEAYVLANGINGVALYKTELNKNAEGAEGTTHFLNNANKAYLPSSVANGVASYSFNFDWAGTTGIEGVEAEGVQNGKIYDITGREVKAITAPGIYIVNGSKVVVK